MRDRLAAPSPASYEAGEPQEYHVRRLFTVLLLASAVPAVAQGTAEPLPSDTVDFAADSMSYDDKAEIITATGNVLIVRGEYRLRASEVAYNRRTGFVEARGNVIVTDPGGNQAFGDKVNVSDTLRDAAIENILLVLQDGGRLAARSGTRVDDISNLSRAVYSPCDTTGEDGCARAPVWQIRAVKVIHNPAKHRLSYRNAYFELLGIPIVYLPSFSHPDGTAGNTSGLLVPDLRYSRSLGVELSLPYYVPLTPSSDLTVTPTIYSAANPAVAVQYRRLTSDGPFKIGMVGTVSRITGALNPSSQFRGYFHANGQFQHNRDWRSTFGFRFTTDDTFPRRYDISRDVTLRNSYQLERFASDSYLSIAGWSFQTLRLGQRQGTQPIALPLIDFHWTPDLDAFALGGRLEVRANTLAITRSAGEDSQRALASVRWDLSKLTPFGQRVTLTGTARGDVYNVQNSAASTVPTYTGRDGVQARGLAAVAVDVEWPFAGLAFGGTQTLTPRIQFVGSSGGQNNRIVNEDARSVDLEDLNLFDINRFPGYDRWEGGARITYGARWTLDRPGVGVIAEAGQSYRLAEKPGVFPVGSGLDRQLSDYVGRTSFRLGRKLDITHRWRIDKNSFAIRRNEIDATVGSRRTFAEIGYSRLNRDIALEDLPDREEVRAGGRVQVSRYWSVFGSAILDLTSRRDDLLSLADGFDPVRHRIGIAYEDECLEFGISWRRDYTQVRDVARGNTFGLRLALKNLGR